MKEITTLGRAIKSTVMVMGELGPIGEEVLAAHNIKEIDLDAIYPGRIRQQIMVTSGRSHQMAVQRGQILPVQLPPRTY